MTIIHRQKGGGTKDKTESGRIRRREGDEVLLGEAKEEGLKTYCGNKVVGRKVVSRGSCQ